MRHRVTVIVVVIPAYNEAAHIEGVISAIPKFVDCILAVNDASTDKTADVLASIEDPRLQIITHERNCGVGGAVLSGYRRALELGADIVVKVDGDGQMDPGDIARLISPIENNLADYCKGVRFRDPEVVSKMPKIRFLGNLGLSFLTKAASGYWNIFDPTNGFTAIGNKALALLNFDHLDQGFFFETHMLTELYHVNAVTLDVPIRTRYGNETSHLGVTHALMTFPMHLARALVKRITRRYFIDDFSAFSVFLISGLLLSGWGLVFGLYNWIANLIRGVETPAGTVMLAALPFLLGSQLLIQSVVLDIANVPKTPIRKTFAGLEDRLTETPTDSGGPNPGGGTRDARDSAEAHPPASAEHGAESAADEI